MSRITDAELAEWPSDQKAKVALITLLIELASGGYVCYCLFGDPTVAYIVVASIAWVHSHMALWRIIRAYEQVSQQEGKR